VLEEVNGDSGVLTLRGIGVGYPGNHWFTSFECASIPYVQKGTDNDSCDKFIFELGTCSGKVPDKILDHKYEIEYCPDQDTIKLSTRNFLHIKKAEEFLQKYDHCDGDGLSVAV